MKNNIKKLLSYSKNLKLLYVEDDELTRGIIVEMFENFFTDISVAVDGEDGLKKFNDGDFDLIISDIMMPKLDGLGMLRAIREIDVDIPVLMLSAHNESKYYLESIKLGIDGFILKPLEREQFIPVLTKVVEKIDLRKQNEEYQKYLELRIEQEVQKGIEKDKAFHESRLQQMREMISMIAHQWRQPLSSISAVSATINLKTKLNKLDKEGILELSSRISEYTQSLSETINDFSDLYKPNQKFVSVSFEDVVAKALKIFKNSLDNDGIELILNYKSSAKIEMYDSEMMQVVLNILKNAQDSFKEKGTKNPKIIIETSDKSISICDNGEGIPEDIIDEIFNPYFSTKDEKNGTGLGLYMSKTIVQEHHKGSLDVTSVDGSTCFIIDLSEKGE